MSTVEPITIRAPCAICGTMQCPAVSTKCGSIKVPLQAVTPVESTMATTAGSAASPEPWISSGMTLAASASSPAPTLSIVDRYAGRVLAKRTDDLLVAGALAACAALCVAFRYLPMVDLPQHYAMVSILLHRTDPAWGFAQRYTTDFLHRPYATVYWLGEALGWVMPLGAAMRIVVAVCTVAPFAGAYALLVATRRSPVWLLPAIPFAFGSLWHWGFLNFLLGTGMLLSGLALVVVSSRRCSRGRLAALFALSVVLLFTHLHGLVMLLLLSPVFAWGWRDGSTGWRGIARVLAPLAPSAAAVALLELPTWASTRGSWQEMNPGAMERVERFAEFLDAGLPPPWPLVWLAAFATVAAAAVLASDQVRRPSRAVVALALAFGAQIVLYFVLPLSTSTVAFVSARHALLIVLFALPLLPTVEGRLSILFRAAGVAIAIAGLVVCARHLACFDREARDFDDVFARMQPDRRVAALVFARSGACTGPKALPYQHFHAYYQAAHGGDLDRSLASRWNIPIRYRDDYVRYAVRDAVEWAPQLFSAEDARHFDYVLVRGPRKAPPELGLHELAHSGAWTLFESLTAAESR